jgi:hypothetical protein
VQKAIEILMKEAIIRIQEPLEIRKYLELIPFCSPLKPIINARKLVSERCLDIIAKKLSEKKNRVQHFGRRVHSNCIKDDVDPNKSDLLDILLSIKKEGKYLTPQEVFDECFTFVCVCNF